MRTRVLYLVMAGILAIAALPTLLYPFTRDQGAYAYVADLIMHGGLPYRDAWDVKPPLIYFVYVQAFGLFGRSELAVRLLETIYVLLTAGLVGLLAWEVLRWRHIAVVAGWLYAFCYFLFVHYYAVANPETFMVPLLVLVAYGLVRSRSGSGHVCPLFAGLVAGWAFWLKPTAAVVVVFLLAWYLWDAHQRGTGSRICLRQVAVFALGGILGLLPIAVYLLTHGWSDFLEVWGAYIGGAYLDAPGLAGNRGWSGQWAVLVRYLRDWRSLIGLSALGCAALLRRRGKGDGLGVVFALLGGCLASVWVQGKLFEYHWIPALSAVAIVGAAGLLRMRAWPKMLALLTIVVLLLGVGYDHVVDYRRLAALLVGRMDRTQYDAHFTIGQDFSRLGSSSAASYLSEHMDATETVLLWGAEPLINFLAQRRSPTKFVFSYMLAGAVADPRQESWRAQFLEQARSGRPAYVVLVENDSNPLSPSGSIAQIAQFPAFREWLEAGYVLETQVEDYLLYRRIQ